VGQIAAEIQREHGVDLRTGLEVTALEGDDAGRVRSVVLSDGSTVEVDVVVVALGSERNVEWLAGSPGGRTAGRRRRCRLSRSTTTALVVDDVFVAGDVARMPHPLYGYQFLSLEHWESAIKQAEIAAHRVPRWTPATHHRPVLWSIQFGLNIKSVGCRRSATRSSSRRDR
jgi:NADPH-dependent 2,4-dienoyl-CoA reductase/sulfur reductase-like enzyme